MQEETKAPEPALATSEPRQDEHAKEKARLEEELRRVKDQMLRVAADFDNFRKRSKRDSEDAEAKARIDVLKEMLPIFDNLARAVEHGASVEDIGPVLEGARMVAKQFEENLAKFGLKRIESVGKFFDPSVHDAIAQEESDEPPGKVLKEFLAGYVLGDKLLRPAMVVVARARKAPAG